MPELPTGTVTFLFTDIQGSTRLWEQHRDAMQRAVAVHDALLRSAIETHSGAVFKALGDAFFAAFPTVAQALAAALDAQRTLQATSWGDTGPLPVRMALHPGAAELRGGDYFGVPVNRVARLLSAGHGGQVLLSQATFDLLGGALPDGASWRDLGAHRLKDLHEPEHIFQLLHPELPAAFPPLRSLEAFAHNLPRQLTSFIGREPEIAAVKQLLANTCLLTLTGAGGCGKTRLALQVAGDLLEEFTEGVWLVELAALSDPMLVPQTVAAALGVREQPGRPLSQTLIDYLRPKQVLLLLDNCEHLLSASAQLADTLLRACPQLRVLATSREGLGIGGETMYRVPSLSLPDPRRLPPVAELSRFQAIRLFVDRAAAVVPSFTLNDQNGTAVAQVCHRLDGIPLAIELASARVKLLPVEKIAARLDDRFRLLTGGSRTALPRQQTLQAMIDWSYDLLSEAERALLCRLSVFSGGWTLEAAEAVCAGESVAAEDVLDLLGRLVDKSLVLMAEQEGEARYHMLETIRQYGVEKLQALGEEAVWRDQHRDWFLQLAEQAEPELRGPSQQEWLARLEEEHDNLRGALVWCTERGEGEPGLRLAGALWWFWSLRGYATEGREHLATLLALLGTEARTAARAGVLNMIGRLTAAQGEYQGAWELLQEGLAIFRELHNPRGIAASLLALGKIATQTRYVGQDPRPLVEESLTIWRELGDQPGIADSLCELGYLAGDPETARALMEESLAIGRRMGDLQSIAGTLFQLGQVADARRDYEALWRLSEESLAISRQLGYQTGITGSLYNLAKAFRYRGDYGTARERFEEALAIARAAGQQLHVLHILEAMGDLEREAGEYARCFAHYRDAMAQRRLVYKAEDFPRGLEDFAGLAGRQGQWERAVRLLGAAQKAVQPLGRSLPLARWAADVYRSTVDGARAALGEEGFAAAWAAGEAMSLNEAVEYALVEPTDA